MSNTKHTPTPWRAVENSWSHTGIYAGDKEVAGLDIYDEATEQDQEDHEALMAANAAFIVRAVNSHEQLVAALRNMLAFVEAVELPNAGSVGEALLLKEDAEAALAAAGG